MTKGALAGYDPVVGRFAAGLFDQHERLERALAKGAPDLEWQPAPGRNSIGMLLVHCAIVEVWWLDVAPRGTSFEDAEPRVRAVLGVGLDDDGMPATPGAAHPATLRGWLLARYLDVLHRARASSEATLRAWRDADLDHELRVGERTLTRGWIVYHVLEHLAQHAGQVRLLSALQRPVAEPAR